MTGSTVDPVGGQGLPPKYINSIERSYLLPHLSIPTVHVREVMGTDKTAIRSDWYVETLAVLWPGLKWT